MYVYCITFGWEACGVFVVLYLTADVFDEHVCI